MTKKDYKLISEAINMSFCFEKHNKECSLHYLVGYLGASLQRDNSKFQYDKFKIACGVK